MSRGVPRAEALIGRPWLGLLVGCSPADRLAEYTGRPLWAEPDLALAEDLGHTPREVPIRGDGALRFEDATVAWGLSAAVGGGNTHGVALGLVDLDGDGAPELLIANGVANFASGSWPSQLWRNLGDGRFEDASAQSGLGALLAGRDLYSVAAGDLDADGDLDLVLGGQPTNVLLENLGGLQFRDATDAWGAGAPSDASLVADGRGKIAVIGDLDGDGALDVVSVTGTQSPPGGVALRNVGGAFEDVTDAMGLRIHPRGSPCAVMFTDYDNDGRADLWIWNDRGGHELLHHDGVGWEALGSSASRVDITNPMGIDAADLDHDGDLDYHVSNIGLHPLLLNDGRGRFDEVARSAGVQGDYGWGLGFEDFDLDGYADLFVTQEDERPWFAYRNLGDGAFEQFTVAHAPLNDTRQAHNVPAVFGDVDGDGRVDVIAANTDGSRITALRNVTEPAGHGLEVVIGRAPGGGTGGVGARVAVLTGDLLQFRDLNGGASRASQSVISARFGLGDWDGADRVVVLWPDGRQIVRTNVPAGVLRLEAP